MNELPFIMEDIEIGQIYKKKGEDYTLFNLSYKFYLFIINNSCKF